MQDRQPGPLTQHEATWRECYIRDHRFSDDRIRRAMQTVAAGKTDDIGGDWPPDDALVIAARQPVSMASAYADLCEQLGVPAPRFIRLALNEPINTSGIPAGVPVVAS